MPDPRWVLSPLYALDFFGVKYSKTLTRTRFNLSLRGAPAHPELVEGRGNLDEAEHTSANRHYYGDEIATLRSQ